MWLRESNLEKKMDAATHDHYVYLQGYYAGRQDGMAMGQWLYHDPTKPSALGKNLTARTGVC